MMVGFPARVVRHKSYSPHQMGTFLIFAPLYRFVRTTWLGCVLGWQMASMSLDTSAEWNGHCVERIVCNYASSPHMGLLLVQAKILVHCDNQTVVDIWNRVCTLYHGFGSFFVLLCFKYKINVCVIHIPGVCNEIADSLSRFQMKRFRKLASGTNILPDSIPEWPTQSFITTSFNAGIMVLPSLQDEHISRD